MSATLKCRNCRAVVREEGEDGLPAGSGIRSYRVYDSLWNPLHEKGAFRLIECLECKHISPVSAFEEEEADLPEDDPDPDYTPPPPNPNQCISRKKGFRCHRFVNHAGEHHDLLMNEKWRGAE